MDLYAFVRLSWSLMQFSELGVSSKLVDESGPIARLHRFLAAADVTVAR